MSQHVLVGSNGPVQNFGLRQHYRGGFSFEYNYWFGLWDGLGDLLLHFECLSFLEHVGGVLSLESGLVVRSGNGTGFVYSPLMSSPSEVENMAS